MMRLFHIFLICTFLKISFCFVSRTKKPTRVKLDTKIVAIRGGETSSTAIGNALSSVDAFFKTSPYAAAFISVGIKSAAADLFAQYNEVRVLNKKAGSKVTFKSKYDFYDTH